MKHFVYQSVERCLLLVVLFCKFKLQKWLDTDWLVLQSDLFGVRIKRESNSEKCLRALA
jgi:hypothetical protein